MNRSRARVWLFRLAIVTSALVLALAAEARAAIEPFLFQPVAARVAPASVPTR